MFETFLVSKKTEKKTYINQRRLYKTKHVQHESTVCSPVSSMIIKLTRKQSPFWKLSVAQLSCFDRGAISILVKSQLHSKHYTIQNLSFCLNLWNLYYNKFTKILIHGRCSCLGDIFPWVFINDSSNQWRSPIFYWILTKYKFHFSTHYNMESWRNGTYNRCYNHDLIASKFSWQHSSMHWPEKGTWDHCHI